MTGFNYVGELSVDKGYWDTREDVTECDECAALVMDNTDSQNKHSSWHARQSENSVINDPYKETNQAFPPLGK